jgi:hypothetical protein
MYHARRYAHATRPSLLVHEIEVTNAGEQPSTVSIAAPTNAGVTTDLDLSPFSPPVVAADAEVKLAAASTSPRRPGGERTAKPRPHLDAGETTGSEYAVSGQNRVAEDAKTAGGGNHTKIAMISCAPCSRMFGCAGNMTVAAKSTVTLYFTTTIVTSLNSTDVNTDAAAIHTAAHTSPSGLLAEHTAAWTERWALGSVSVAGDKRLAEGVNASLYAIRSAIRADWPYGLSPGGLTSDGYNGHTFWDQETWMWPPLLFLDPPSAASALQYRFDRRNGAAQKAVDCGSKNHAYCPPSYKNTTPALMFPWESAFTGYETQFGGGRIGPWGEFEQHISGDISFAARQYFYATQDASWLKEVGYPLIAGIASFYAARIEAREGETGLFDFNQVMGPDEYNYPVNNSHYTNAVAMLAIRAAIEFAPLVGATVPIDYAAKSVGLQVDTAPVPVGSLSRCFLLALLFRLPLRLRLRLRLLRRRLLLLLLLLLLPFNCILWI